MSVSPASVQLKMSPSDGGKYPRVVLKLKHPPQCRPTTSDSDAWLPRRRKSLCPFRRSREVKA
eukprot:4102040-Pleurochrysis_carterae.AAC.1